MGNNSYLCHPRSRRDLRFSLSLPILWKGALGSLLGLFLATGSLLADPPASPLTNDVAQIAQPERPSLAVSVTIFVLAILLGVEVIGKVPATLHTPLMSGSNAISGITVVGAVIAAGALGRYGPIVAFFAIVLAMINVVGGFLVTHRMLQMFKRK